MAIRNITFDVGLFLDPEDVPRSRRALLWMMEALIKVNLTYLATHPTVPLYQSGVVYRAERNTEIWRDVPNILKYGWGDCEDLACWRAAELQLAGIAARAWIKWRDHNNVQMYHAVVRLPNGEIEDPSIALGMSGHPIVMRPVYVNPG